MTTERKLNFSLVALLAVLFIGMFASRFQTTAGAVFSVLIFVLLMLAYVGLADETLVASLRQRLGARATTNLLPLLALLVLYVAYALFLGKLNARDLGVAAAYLLIPALLVMLHGQRPMKLSMWLVIAILGLWFPVEFGWLPRLSLPPAGGESLFKFMPLVVVLYVFLVVRPLPDMGYTYILGRNDWWKAAGYFALFTALFAIPLGVPLNFIAETEHVRPVWQWPVSFVLVFFFTGVPEEVLFRGVIHNLIQKSLRGKHAQWVALGISSLIFGFAHANNNNPPFVSVSIPGIGPIDLPWVYILLASIAGWFYGLTYLKTGKLTSAAIMHALVDTCWGLFLAGKPVQ